MMKAINIVEQMLDRLVEEGIERAAAERELNELQGRSEMHIAELERRIEKMQGDKSNVEERYNAAMDGKMHISKKNKDLEASLAEARKVCGELEKQLAEERARRLEAESTLRGLQRQDVNSAFPGVDLSKMRVPTTMVAKLLLEQLSRCGATCTDREALTTFLLTLSKRAGYGPLAIKPHQFRSIVDEAWPLPAEPMPDEATVISDAWTEKTPIREQLGPEPIGPDLQVSQPYEG